MGPSGQRFAEANSSTRASQALRAITLAALAVCSPWDVSAGGRRLLDQNCPATYPVSFAGTCYLCPADHPFFYSRKCFTDQVSASATGSSSADGVPATSQPITDPPDTEQAVSSTMPASQSSVSLASGGSATTYSCGDPSQVLWNNNCYSCPTDHPYFSEGSCHSTNPNVSATNPNSASAAAARQSAYGSGSGRRLLDLAGRT